jgi:hypothetical protein
MSRAGNLVPIQDSLTERTSIVGAEVVQCPEPIVDVKDDNEPVLNFEDSLSGIGNVVDLRDSNKLAHGMTSLSALLASSRNRPVLHRQPSIGVASKESARSSVSKPESRANDDGRQRAPGHRGAEIADPLERTVNVRFMEVKGLYCELRRQ